MPEFFVLLLMQVTIFSSVTALILIAVKQIFKCRIPPRIGVVLWIILLARLVCPIFPESEVSIYNLIPEGRNIMFSLTNTVSEELSEREEIRASDNNPYVVRRVGDEQAKTVSESVSVQDDVITVSDYFAEVVSGSQSREELENTADRISIVLLAVYLAGIAVSLTGAVFAYKRSVRRTLMSSEICGDEDLLAVYRETALRLGIRENKIPPLRCGLTDMLVGCRRAQITCREDIGKKEAKMVFAHELIHYKFLDNPIILFSTVVACLFWYNPLIWIVRNILREDIEVLCDARTLEYCNIPRTEYAMMLCSLSSYAEILEAGCHMSASGRRLKNRLKTISSDKNRRFLSKFVSALLCAAIMMLCLTNPIISQNSDYSTYIENYARLTGGDVRAMHLYSKETVSTYLSQISTLLREWCGGEYAAVMGNGSLEKFKRICASSEVISGEIVSAVQAMRSDEPLNVKNCTVISDCVTRLTAAECDMTEYRLLPERITAEDMNEVLSKLTEAESEALLKCYNRGVEGAEVSFEMFYTEAMMDLISERISDDWNEAKVMGFFSEYDLTADELSSFSDALRNVVKTLRSSRVYICDLAITAVERETLTEILGAAFAGQNSEVYYLKKIEDGCSFDLAERLLRRGGFTHEEMIRGYAEIGEHSGDDCGSYVYVRVRQDEAAITGTIRPAIRESAERMYSLGLIDTTGDGVIDLAEQLSCGQGIAYAYRLAAAMMPVN